jgi:hypothetical protein
VVRRPIGNLFLNTSPGPLLFNKRDRLVPFVEAFVAGWPSDAKMLRESCPEPQHPSVLASKSLAIFASLDRDWTTQWCGQRPKFAERHSVPPTCHRFPDLLAKSSTQNAGPRIPFRAFRNLQRAAPIVYAQSVRQFPPFRAGRHVCLPPNFRRNYHRASRAVHSSKLPVAPTEDKIGSICQESTTNHKIWCILSS